MMAPGVRFIILYCKASTLSTYLRVGCEYWSARPTYTKPVLPADRRACQPPSPSAHSARPAWQNIPSEPPKQESETAALAFSSMSRPPNEAYTSVLGGALERSSAIL